MKCFLICVCISIFLFSVESSVISSSNTGNEATNFRSARKEDGVPGAGGKWRVASKFIEDCLEKDDYSNMASCFGVKAVAVVDRASRMSNINLLPGITFVQNEDISQDFQRNARALSEEDIENSLSAEPSQKSSKLIDMLLESMSRFVQTHSLNLRVPKASSEDLQRALDEGRAKLKKKFLPFIGLLAGKIFLILPLLLGTVGFLALKALVIGKIALIIAGILALQKYSSSGSSWGNFGGKLTDGWTSPSNTAGWSSGSSSPGGYYRRSIETSAPVSAHQLAYNAHIPNETSES